MSAAFKQGHPHEPELNLAALLYSAQLARPQRRDRMPYQAKSGSPATFNLTDAFIAAITGDATWSWLLDWVPYLGNQTFITEEFCAAGPVFAEPLNITDLIPTVSGRSPADALKIVVSLARLGGVAKDRVFGTYCEQITDPADWCLEFIETMTGPHDTQLDVWIPFPAGSTAVRIGLQSLNQGTSGANTAAFLTNDQGVGGIVQIHGYDSGTHTFSGAWEGPFNRASHNYLYLSAKYDYIAEWHIEFGPCFGETVPYGPAPQEKPPGLLTPQHNEYATVQDLGNELDRQEIKLDFLHTLVQYLVGNLPGLPGTPEEPEEVDPDEEKDLTGAIGVIVSVSNIPDSIAVGFGNPQQYARLGRLNLGTADSWYPSIPLTHSPLVIQPLPPNCTRSTVNVIAGVQATVTPILPPK